jgi:hypothetical protein
MSDLDEIISVTFAIDSSGITKQNFFVPMLLSHTASFAERIRFYSSLAAVVADTQVCPNTTCPEYLYAAAEFAQTPHPALIAIGRASTAITLAYKVAPRTVAAGSVYALDIAGTGVTSTRISYTPAADLTGTLLPRTTNVLTLAAHGFTTGDGPVRVSNSGGALPTGLAVDTDYWLISVTANTFSFASSKANALATTAVVLSADGSGTQTIRRAQNDVVCANLLQQANAVVGKNYTVAQVTGAGETDYLTFTATVANAWFALGVVDATLMDTFLTNAGDPSSDLAAILAASAQWYQLITWYNSPAYALAASAWVEANQRAYIVDFNDTNDLNTVITGSSGTGDAINATGRTRTLWQYHPRPQDALSAALSGRIVALNPGSWTAAFKTLSGPVAVVISDTQKINLKARRGNYYTTRASRSCTLYGMVGSTSYKFFDIVVGLDYIYNDIQTRVFGVLVGNDKVGFSDEDIDQIAGAIRGGIASWKSDAYKIISAGTADSTSDPIPTIAFPTVANIDSTNRSNRNLPNGVLVFRLLGAVQSAAVRAIITF